MDWTDYDSFMFHQDIMEAVKAFLQAKQYVKI